MNCYCMLKASSGLNETTICVGMSTGDICYIFLLREVDLRPLYLTIRNHNLNFNKASQAIRSPRTVPFFLLISLLDGYSFANVDIKGIVAFKHLKKL